MTNEERDIQRKLKVLQHAEKIGNARKASANWPSIAQQCFGKANAREGSFLHRRKRAKPDKKGARVLPGAQISALATRCFSTESAESMRNWADPALWSSSR